MIEDSSTLKEPFAIPRAASAVNRVSLGTGKAHYFTPIANSASTKGLLAMAEEPSAVPKAPSAMPKGASANAKAMLF